MASIYDKASLVLIPSGTKTSKVYSQVPTNGDGDFTFSRSTAATRVNASGNIEKETENLLLQSNQFDTTWATTFASITGGQSGYDGSSNAWKLQNTSGGVGRVVQSLSTSGVQTFSIYAKGGNVDWMALYLATSPTPYVYYDITNGVLGTSVGGNDIDASIEAAGNGYYRCQITYNGSPSEVRVFIGASDGTLSTNSGDNIYIQDAQLEQGLVARDYIETTTTAIYGGITDNVPRLDYTDSSCPALLLEPQRTNRIIKSEYFGGYAVGGAGLYIVTDNYGISPEGVQNACRIQHIGGSTYIVSNNISISTNDVVTISFWAKGTAGEKIVLYSDGSAGANVFKTITLTEDWVRYEGTTSAATANGNCTPHILVGYGANPTASDFQVYGWQAEIGSYATSYIPTYGSAVTRNADATDDLDTSSLLTQSNNNTFFGEVVNHKNTGNTRFIASYDSARDNGDRILIYTGNGSSNYTLHCQYKVSGETSIQFNIATNVNYGDTIKFAVVFNGTEMIGFANGVKTATATIVDADNFNKFYITDVANEVGVYKQLIIFPTALTDQEAIDLTTI